MGDTYDDALAEVGDSWDADPNDGNWFDGVERPPRAEDKVRRHRGNGRPYIRALDPQTGAVLAKETLMTRVTTYIKGIDAKEALIRWYQRQVAKGIATRPDMFLAQIMQFQDDRQGLDRVCEQAKEAAAAGDKAYIGTAVHALTERWDLGLPLQIVPPQYQGDLQAWVDVMKYFQIRDIERLMVHDEIQTAGTPDRVVRYLPCEVPMADDSGEVVGVCGREHYILDLKTGRVDNYTELEIAMQLGIYSRSKYYDLSTGERTATDDICQHRGIVIALPAGSGVAVTHWVDIWTGWEIAYEVARRVRWARSQKGLMRVFDPQPNLFFEIEKADSRDALRRLRAEHLAAWTPAHTLHAIARLESMPGS